MLTRYAIAAACLATIVPTSASAVSLSELLDIDTTAIEDALPGAAINVLTGSGSPFASSGLGGMSSGGGSCGQPAFRTPCMGGGSLSSGYMPQFGFVVIPITSITIHIELTININLDLEIGGDFGRGAASPTRCCVCSGF